MINTIHIINGLFLFLKQVSIYKIIPHLEDYILDSEFFFGQLKQVFSKSKDQAWEPHDISGIIANWI